jgi:hypothetical protein
MTFARTKFVALDHVRIAMPPGEEAKARAFYGDVLGMMELAKPAGRGGCWFAGGEGACVQIRCVVDDDFRPARAAHPAVMVSGLDELAGRIAAARDTVRWEAAGDGPRRFSCDDPFGNKLEFIGSLEDED